MTHAEAMAQTLAARGVQYAFGLPGGEIIAFIDACRRAGIRFFLAGHESSAACMAQVVGQMTGVPGVCVATLGPGATNLITGTANAWLDRAPMLAITAQIAAASIQTMTHQRLPLQQLFAPITKASFDAQSEDPIEMVHRSLDLAARPRPGPVHIALASDRASQDYESGDAHGSESSSDAQTGSVAEVARRLESAERPLILIGLGATAGCAPAIRTLIEKLQAPFLVTAKAKGIASEEHPLFAGVASGMAIDHEIVETIRNADLILAVGFDPVECDKTWFAETNVAALDSVSMAEGAYRPAEAIGNLEALVVELTGLIANPKPWPAELLESRRAAIERGGSEVTALSPLRLIQELRTVFPADGIATCDVGSHKLLMGQFWKCTSPGTFLMSNGLSAMGFGVPAAIAAQLVEPTKAVMSVVGDGGLLMMVHDLALIRELALPVVIVVLVDRSLSLIRIGAERRGLEPHGVDFIPPDFTRIAHSFGIAGQRATSIASAKACLETALLKRIPLVLEIPINHREYQGLL